MNQWHSAQAELLAMRSGVDRASLEELGELVRSTS
jgi:hypothetical protein